MGEIESNPDGFELRTGITQHDFRRLELLPLFSGLQPNDLRKLLSTSSIRRYPEHTTLFLEGEPADRFFVVMDGGVKLFRLCENGHEVVISMASPGESFAEAAVFDGQTFTNCAVSIADTRLLAVSAKSLLLQLKKSTDLAINMLGVMSRQLHGNFELLHKLSSMSTKERLADFLINLADTDNSKASITLPTEKHLIAAQLGMQPETFSRALAKLESVGVKSSGHDVMIEDMCALKAMVKLNAVI